MLMRARTNTDVTRTTEFSTIQDFQHTDQLSDGHIIIRYQEHTLDFELDKSPADTLLVCFHGALTRTVEWPMFVGHGVTAELGNVARLSIADPSIGMHETLALAWYAGNDKMVDLQKVTASVVDKVATLIGAKRVMFFGSSGGGFAALQMSWHFPGSLAVVSNPQTSIGRYLPIPVKGYLRRCWSDRPIEELPIEHDMTALYEGGHDNTVAYIQNTRDEFHVKNHQEPFLAAVPDLNRVWCMSDAWGTNPKALHAPPPKRIFKNVLTHAAASQGDWPSGLQHAGFEHASKTTSGLTN